MSTWSVNRKHLLLSQRKSVILIHTRLLHGFNKLFGSIWQSDEDSL